MSDIILGYTLEEKNGIGYCTSWNKSNKWVKKHTFLSRFTRPKPDHFVMVEGDTLDLSKNRDYTEGCGRGAKILWSVSQPHVHIRFTQGRFTFPRVSEYNDSNFRDLRPVCPECGCVECKEHAD